MREWLGRNRNIVVMGASTFGLGLGEELWLQFIPKYLIGLGATPQIVGFFASLKDLLEGLYQYPGGIINDRFGRRRALSAFTMLAMAGYATYALASHWAVMFVGVALVMSWKAGAFPTTFAVIGEALPPGKRVIAFSVQSILVRLPRVIGAPIGGMMIVQLGVIAGVRTALTATLVLASIVLCIQLFSYRDPSREAEAGYERKKIRAIWGDMPGSLRSLLVADSLVRIGDGVASSFIVLYVTITLGFSPQVFGLMYALQMAVSILLYLPMGKLAEITGRRSMVACSFVFFALFPLAVRFAAALPLLVGAFVIGGLKEMGEPARKSLIVDLSDQSQHGRTVGLYYTVRNLVIVPAGTLGGYLWSIRPAFALETASAIAGAGLVGFLLLSSRVEPV